EGAANELVGEGTARGGGEVPEEGGLGEQGVHVRGHGIPFAQSPEVPAGARGRTAAVLPVLPCVLSAYRIPRTIKRRTGRPCAPQNVRRPRVRAPRFPPSVRWPRYRPPGRIGGG